MGKSKTDIGVITLKYPDHSVKPVLTEVTMRAPRARDQIAASRASDNAEEGEIHFISMLCSLTFDEVAGFELYDYLQCQKELNKFIEGKHSPTQVKPAPAS